MKNYSSSRVFALTSVALATLAWVVSCGGSSGDSAAIAPTGESTKATIDMASVIADLPALTTVVPICSTTSPLTSTAASSAIVVPAAEPSMASAAFIIQSITAPQVYKASLVPSPSATTVPVKPADKLGACGGRMTYSAYSHLSGVTTATRLFDNYCTIDSKTGGRRITNGSIDFVSTGTPTAIGPITSKVTASSVAGLARVKQDAAGKVSSSQVLAFSNFLYTVGVPGGNPTVANPSSYSIDEFTVTDKLTNKSYRESGYKMTFSETATGGQQFTLSGRGYRANGDSFEVNTTSPVLSDAFGSMASGAISFTGANNTVAVATIVPGGVNQATMTVNGVAVAGQPACR